MAVYFGSFFLVAAPLGAEGMAAAQIAASLVQMTAAIVLARREGFFGGIGSRVGRLALSLVPITACCMLATARVPLYASIVCAVLFPFGARWLLGALRVFDDAEKERILGLVRIAQGRRLAAWLLSARAR